MRNVSAEDASCDPPHSNALDGVYAAESLEQLAAAYAAWSNGYDRETAALGYCLPFVIAAWVARYIRKRSGPLLDAGCGSGLSGTYLRALGYAELEGLDFSPQMLARGRVAYRSVTQAELGALSCGPMTPSPASSPPGSSLGHSPAAVLHELARITPAGGHAVFTVRTSMLESGGFRSVFDDLERTRRWRPVEESPPFRAFAIAEPEVLVQAFVLELL